jgi:hypothetical protein
MSEIEEAVARAIKDALHSQDIYTYENGDSFKADGFIDVGQVARAAIDAYEAAKRGGEEPYVTRVENGVTYWSNGLCSQSVPGSKEFAEAQLTALQEASAAIPDLIRGLNPFDDEPTRLRSYEAKWEPTSMIEASDVDTKTYTVTFNPGQINWAGNEMRVITPDTERKP